MKVHSKIARVRGWLLWFAAQTPQSCYFCKEPIAPEAFAAGDTSDGVLIHHVDHNREHNTPNNLVVAHRTCHRKHHIACNKMAEEYGPVVEELEESVG